MEIHPDQPSNPLESELVEMLDYERELPNDWRRAGRLRAIDVAEHNEQIVKNSLLEVQNTCLPTLNNLRNERNFSQLQERVYQGLLPHFDALNICLLRSRTAKEGDFCFDQYKTNFETQFKPKLKDILLEY